MEQPKDQEQIVKDNLEKLRTSPLRRLHRATIVGTDSGAADPTPVIVDKDSNKPVAAKEEEEEITPAAAPGAVKPLSELVVVESSVILSRLAKIDKDIETTQNNIRTLVKTHNQQRDLLLTLQAQKRVCEELLKEQKVNS